MIEYRFDHRINSADASLFTVSPIFDDRVSIVEAKLGTKELLEAMVESIKQTDFNAPYEVKQATISGIVIWIFDRKVAAAFKMMWAK